MNVINCNKSFECGKESNCVGCPKFEPNFKPIICGSNKVYMSVKFKDLDTKTVVACVDTKDLLEQLLRYHSLIKLKVVPQVDHIVVCLGDEYVLLDISSL